MHLFITTTTTTKTCFELPWIVSLHFVKILVSLKLRGFIINGVPRLVLEQVFGALSQLSSLPDFTQEHFQIYLNGLGIWSLLDTLIGYSNCLIRTSLNFFLLVF